MFILLPALVALTAAVFPAVAGATPPTDTPCTATTPAGVPCYTAAPTMTPSNELANPPEGRILSVPSGPTLGVPGTWTPATVTGSDFTYVWQDCNGVPTAPTTTCNNISGATTRTYQVAPTDVGSYMQFIATVKIPGVSTPGIWVWDSTGPATQAAPIDRVAPSVSGPTQDGQMMTANPGTWNGTQPITYTYAWRRCDATGKNCGAVFTSPSPTPTYTLQDADVGHTMSVVVTASNTVNGAPASTQLGSFAGGLVTPANTAAPGISGNAKEGQTLTDTHGSWLPGSSSIAYQWEDCDASGNGCTAIGGANSPSYKLTSADVGHTVVVQEVATSNGASSLPATSGPTGVVQPAKSGQGGGGSGGNGGNGGNGGQNGGANSGQNGGGNGGQGTSSGSVNKAQIRALLLKVLAAKGKAGTIRGILRHGGYKFTFVAPSSGRLVISWYSNNTLVATVALVFHRSGRANAVVFLTSSGRSLLSGRARMHLLAKGAFTPAGHGTIRASKRITLKA